MVCASLEEITHSLKIVNYLPIKMHNRYNNIQVLHAFDYLYLNEVKGTILKQYIHIQPIQS